MLVAVTLFSCGSTNELQAYIDNFHEALNGVEEPYNNFKANSDLYFTEFDEAVRAEILADIATIEGLYNGLSSTVAPPEYTEVQIIFVEAGKNASSAMQIYRDVFTQVTADNFDENSASYEESLKEANQIMEEVTVLYIDGILLLVEIDNPTPQEEDEEGEDGEEGDESEESEDEE